VAKRRAADERRRLANAYVADRTRENRDALIEAWYPLLRGTLRSVLGKRRQHLLSSEDRPLHDELVSAANLALVEAAETYRTERGAAFGTWLWIRVKYAILETLRQEGNMPRGRERKMVSLEALLGEDGTVPDDAPHDVRLAAEWLQTHPDDRTRARHRYRLINMLLADLGDRDMEIVHRVLMLDERAEDVAKDVGLSKQRVRAIVREAFREGRRMEEINGQGEVPG